MLKLRLMGTKRELKWFNRFLNRCDVLKIVRVSDAYKIKGSNRYYRMYIDIGRNLKKQEVSYGIQIQR